MDLDEVMGRIYTNCDKNRRETHALAEYTDVRNQYGDSSKEEKQLYDVLVSIFPKMEQYREVIRSLEAGFAAGDYQLLPEDTETVEAALRKADLR